MWCYQPCPKKKEKKGSYSWGNPINQGRYGLPKGASHPGSVPYPHTVLTWHHVTLGCSPSLKKSHAGEAETLSHSGPHKSRKFRALCIVSIRLLKCLWFMAQTTGIVCARRRRALWRNVNGVGKSDHYFLFYGSADVTKWTALVGLHACACLTSHISVWKSIILATSRRNLISLTLETA